MRNCWDLKGCPASHYMECEAYKRQIDCWEIQKGCLCHAYDSCQECPVFASYQEEQRKSE